MDEAGRTIRIAAPRVDAAETSVVTLRATAQGAAVPESRQELSVRVVPAPVLRRAERAGPRKLRVIGDHLDLAGLVVTLDGIDCPVVRVRRRAPELEGAPQRAIVRLSPAARKALRAGGRTLRAVEPVAGFDAVLEL
jgi:hypothetical protein